MIAPSFSSMLYIISTTIDYMLNYPVREREGEREGERGERERGERGERERIE